jgi:coenzyme PQQ precursor peptide PqqA
MRARMRAKLRPAPVAHYSTLVYFEHQPRAAPSTTYVQYAGRWPVVKFPPSDTKTKPMEEMMAWTAPKLSEVNCGMEINMYSPSEDERRDEYDREQF